jgi:NAD(P)H dehydrogenase (quinone)
MGLLSWKMKRFFDEVMCDQWMKVDGKIACAFSSSGGWGGGAELACQSLLTVLMNFGFLVFGVTDYVGKLTTLHYGAVTARQPRDDEAREACRKLGKRLAEWVAAYIGGRADQHPLAKSDERLQPGQE